MGRRNSVAMLLAVWAVLFSVTEQAAGAIFGIDSLKTFLHTESGDPAPGTVPIDLSDLGLAPGQLISLQRLGDFDNGLGGDGRIEMIGVFSSTPILLLSNELNRVANAIEAGVDFTTEKTWSYQEPTDIPQDFFIDDIQIQIPTGATYLFVAASDSLYWDNNDPNNDFAVAINAINGANAVPEPTSVFIFAGLGTIGLIGYGARRRIKKDACLSVVPITP